MQILLFCATTCWRALTKQRGFSRVLPCMQTTSSRKTAEFKVKQRTLQSALARAQSSYEGEHTRRQLQGRTFVRFPRRKCTLSWPGYPSPRFKKAKTWLWTTLDEFAYLQLGILHSLSMWVSGNKSTTANRSKSMLRMWHCVRWRTVLGEERSTRNIN